MGVYLLNYLSRLMDTLFWLCVSVMVEMFAEKATQGQAECYLWQWPQLSIEGKKGLIVRSCGVRIIGKRISDWENSLKPPEVRGTTNLTSYDA